MIGKMKLLCVAYKNYFCFQVSTYLIPSHIKTLLLFLPFTMLPTKKPLLPKLYSLLFEILKSRVCFISIRFCLYFALFTCTLHVSSLYGSCTQNVPHASILTKILYHTALLIFDCRFYLILLLSSTIKILSLLCFIMFKALKTL